MPPAGWCSTWLAWCGPESATGGHHVGIHSGSHGHWHWPAGRPVSGPPLVAGAERACAEHARNTGLRPNPGRKHEPIGCPMWRRLRTMRTSHAEDCERPSHSCGEAHRLTPMNKGLVPPVLGITSDNPVNLHWVPFIQSQAYPPNRPVMRPLFAIAPLAFVLAFFSPSTAEVSASFESFKAMFASSNKAAVERTDSSAAPARASLDH